ncbi:TPA: hypothetical protein ACX6PR_001254 [Photobacterium damselae]
MNISLILLFFLSGLTISNNYKKEYAILIYICVLILYGFLSLFLNNEPMLVIRFFIISILIILSYGVLLKSEKVVFSFLLLMLIQAVVVIGIEIYMVLNFNGSDYSMVRHYFLDNGFGDVYTYNGYFYKVQLKGNALLPIGWMISFYLYFVSYNKKYLILSLCFLISILFAGNFAFYLVCILFFSLIIIQNIKHKKVFLLSTFLLTSFFIYFIGWGWDLLLNIFDSKFGSSTSSMGTRFDQFDVLINNLNTNIFTLLFGNGYGNLIKVVTSARDYSGYIYYELQSIYFLNQMGIVLFSLFIVANIYLSFKYIKIRNVRFIYFLYIVYALSNPYILDTNQIVTIITLLNFDQYLRSRLN